MAKAKKKESLTPEERLQAALVPESEQPYPVPGNWCWTRLGAITEIIGGGTPSSNVPEYYSHGTIPWISPADLSGYTDIYISKGAKNITTLGLEKSSAKMLPTNTVCLSSRAPIGYVVIAENPLCTNQGFKSFLPSSCYLARYLYWYLKGNKELLESYASGTTFLELSASKAGLVEFPLAPLAEQQRIVDRIESLFTKLDEAKQKAQDALDSFETRKAAILHKAFTGELTARWRKEHGVGMESWEKLKIGTYAQVKGGKRLPKGHKLVTERTAHPYLRIADFGDGTINVSDLHYITEDTFSQIKNYIINKEDVYISIVGSIGKAGVIPESLDGANLTENAARIISVRTLPQYLCAFLSSPEAQSDIQGRIRSATLGKLSLLNIKDIETPVPSINEQSEIVRILDDLLAKEQQAKEAAEGVLEQIDLMKKAILARAFRGELGTNDPREESAVELLKQVL